MPFDSTPSKTVTHPSVEGLIAWLETQPGETEYSYVSSVNCLLCRYLRAQGVPVFTLDQYGYDVKPGGPNIAYPAELHEVSLGRPRTYSAALSRARSLVETR